MKQNRLFSKTRTTLAFYYAGVMSLILIMLGVGTYQAIKRSYSLEIDRDLQSTVWNPVSESRITASTTRTYRSFNRTIAAQSLPAWGIVVFSQQQVLELTAISVLLIRIIIMFVYLILLVVCWQ